MKTINYEDLKFINNEKYNSGSYGIIKKCTLNDKEYVCKYFSDNSYLKGKKRKISLLSEIDKKGLYVPRFWVKKDNNKNMYLSEFCNGKDIAFLSDESYETKLKNLKNIKELILEMHGKGIIHSDLSSSNILYSNNNIGIIDFDNSNYRGFKTNIYHTNDYCMDFIKTYGIKPELDIFMFNLLTYSIMNDDTNYHMIRNNIWLNNYGIFNNPSGIKICKSLFLDDDFPNKDFLIDTIDETNLSL